MLGTPSLFTETYEQLEDPGKEEKGQQTTLGYFQQRKMPCDW